MPGIKLTKKQKKAVEKWLAMTEGVLQNECPFEELSQDCTSKVFQICQSWFPKTDEHLCPCHAYTKRHVLSVAKKMLE